MPHEAFRGYVLVYCSADALGSTATAPEGYSAMNEFPARLKACPDTNLSSKALRD
jgi:hypothetical protein